MFCAFAGLRPGWAFQRFIHREVRRDRGHRHHHDQESAAPGRQWALALSSAARSCRPLRHFRIQIHVVGLAIFDLRSLLDEITVHPLENEFPHLW